MNNKKMLYGILSIIAGFLLLVILINIVSKPDNQPFTFQPIESLKTYFFSFVYSIGNFGYLVGGILLFLYFAVFYRIGSWFYMRNV